MDPRTREQQAQDWDDAIPDEEDGPGDAYEPTYRDGTTKNECWGEEPRGD